MSASFYTGQGGGSIGYVVGREQLQRECPTEIIDIQGRRFMDILSQWYHPEGDAMAEVLMFVETLLSPRCHPKGDVVAEDSL